MANTPNKKKQKPKTSEISKIAEFYKLSSMVMSKVGITGFICISIVAYIFFFVPASLKDEITKTWLLFKNPDALYIYRLILISLLVLILIQNYFYRRAIKLKDERIKEISAEKSSLQEKLLGKPLNSTKETL